MIKPLAVSRGDEVRVGFEDDLIYLDIRPQGKDYGDGWDLFLTPKQAKKLIKEIRKHV